MNTSAIMLCACICVCGIGVGLASGCASSTPTEINRPIEAVSKSAKRSGPAPVEPVRVGTLVIQAVHWGLQRGLGQNGGYIAATDAQTGQELWLLKVYSIEYDPRLERDVQDVFITDMKLIDAGALIEIHDELGRVFIADPVKRSVQPR